MFASSVRFGCSYMQNFNIEFRSDGSLKRFVLTVRSANFALRLRFEYSSGFARDRLTHQLHCRSLIFAYLCRFHVSSMSPVCRRIVTMCYRSNWLPIGGHCLPFEYIRINSNMANRMSLLESIGMLLSVQALHTGAYRQRTLIQTIRLIRWLMSINSMNNIQWILSIEYAIKSMDNIH